MPTSSTSRQRLGGRIRALTLNYGPDAPIVLDTKRELAELRITMAIEEALEAAPPLKAEQVDRLTTILRGGAR